MNSYIRKYKPRSEIEASISEAIARHDRALEEEKRSAELLQMPDEDGWITVTKHGLAFSSFVVLTSKSRI